MQNKFGDKRTRDLQLSVREILSSKKEEPQKDIEFKFSNSLDHNDDDEAGFDARMRQQILRRRKELGDVQPKQKKQNGGSSPRYNDISAPRSNAEKTDDDQQRPEKLSLKKKGLGSEARAEHLSNADADLQLLNEAERGRLLQKQKKRRLQGREDDVLAKLEMFKKSISAKPNDSGSKSEGGGDEDLSDWKAVRLTFAPEHAKDNMSRKDDPNDYVVHDPLLEKGKEKFNRMQAKLKRQQREWTGKSLT